MGRVISSWSFVPKPRSAIKTVEWLPALLKVEGKNWDVQNKDGERLVRREYLKYAHPFDEFKQDDPEINARMEFSRYQTLGLTYLDKNKRNEKSLVRITSAGKAMASLEIKDELMLRQLLKWQIPSATSSLAERTSLHIFPLQIVLKVLGKYKAVNRFEIAFSIFTCADISQIENVFERIDIFRSLVKDQPAHLHKEIFIKNFATYNGNTGNKPETYLGNYDDTLCRYLEFTGIFETSGRGLFTKLFVPDRSLVKFNLLLQSYEFKFFENYDDIEKFYEYFGNPYVRQLPWDTKDALSEIVKSKLALLESRNVDAFNSNLNGLDKNDLQTLDAELTNQILHLNEKEFVERTSKTKVERSKILEKFKEIENGNEDLAALWMEVNTWKSLVAMSGKHYVKRNFNMELDLTPRSFAAGTHSTPDMEFYNQKYILIPEVSIQKGVQQWISEGSSVVEHVYKFLEVKKGKQFFGIDKVEQYMNLDNLKAIYGLFIAQKLNTRLIWQFYVLSRETWMGEPIAIVPLELTVYIKILEHMYENEVAAPLFEKLIESIAQSSHTTDSYEAWMNMQDELISSFLSAKSVIS